MRKTEHATNSAYVNGCRCRPCTTAHADYSRTYAREQRRLARLGRAVLDLTRQKEPTP